MERVLDNSIPRLNFLVLYFHVQLRWRLGGKSTGTRTKTETRNLRGRKFEQCITLSKECYYQNQWEEKSYELEVTFSDTMIFLS